MVNRVNNGVCSSFVLSFAIIGLMGMGCSSGPKAFTKGQYDDPTKVELLDDRYNEADMQQMADTMVRSIADCPAILKYFKENQEGPKVIVETVANRTEEHIDMESLTDKIRTALIKTGKVRFMNKKERDTLHDESTYVAGGKKKDLEGYTPGGDRTKKATKKKGKATGADYILSGTLVDHIQQVSDEKLIYYKLTINLTNIDDETIDCSEEREIKKKYGLNRT